MTANKNEFPNCNLCGLTCELKLSPDYQSTLPWINWDEQIPEAGGLLEAKVIGGYGSTPGNGCGTLDDLTRYKFSLCEFCLDWLFERFQLSVQVDAPMNDYLLKDGEAFEDGLARMGIVKLCEQDKPLPWRPATQRIQEDEWRKMKDEFFNEKQRRDAAREAVKK